VTTSTGHGYPIDAVREQFPALSGGTAYFDGPGGSQVPRPVAAAVAAAMTGGLSNRGRVTASERAADDIVVGARAAIGDLLGADPRGVVFGRSMTALTYEMSRALARRWQAGDEVVVTSLDHDANIRPWLAAAASVGATVRWAEFDPQTGELPVRAVTEQLSARSRLVAVTGASNLLGTRPDLGPILAAAHGVGALVYVDGVHLTPHTPVDASTWGADFYAVSPYKFLGPHLGVVAARPEMLESLRPDKLLPATEVVPERFELGTLPYEMLAGVRAAVDFLADLVPGEGTRRARLMTSMTTLEAYETKLAARLEAGLGAVPGLRLHAHPSSRTPTLLFSLDGQPAADLARQLAGRGINAPAGSFYALEASRRLGLGDGGAVRAGVAPYTSEEDVDRLVAAVREIGEGAG